MNLLKRKGSFKSCINFFVYLYYILFLEVPFTNNSATFTTNVGNSNENLLINSNDQLKVLEYYEEEYSKVVGLYEKLNNSEEFKNYSYFLIFLKKYSKT